MQTELLFVLLGAGLVWALMKRSSSKVDENLQKQKLNDIELAKRAKELNRSIEQIKKELAESNTGLKNMTPEQIEDYWKKN